MRKSFMILISILAFALASAAQDVEPKNCPAISVTGPAGVVALGELATYIASVDAPEVQKQGLRYSWSINVGEIVSGQGTLSIQIRRTGYESLTATVEITGLPEGCPNSASEHTPECGGFPIPVKIGEFDGASIPGIETDLGDVVEEMNDNPTNQFYVFFAYAKKPGPPSALKREAHALNYLSSAIGDTGRITSVKIFRGIDRVQFWRVPPGASNPECEGCDTVSCPAISITGPAGVIAPGDSMEFIGAVSGDVPRNLTYRWTVVPNWKILAGQGTLRLILQTPLRSDSNITATLEILGLPAGCPNLASETAPFVIAYDPVLFDEFGALARRDQIERFANAVAELKGRASAKLFIIDYFPRKTSSAAVRKRLAWVSDQLKRVGKLSADEFEIITSDSFDDDPRTKIYIIPPGAENPAP